MLFRHAVYSNVSHSLIFQHGIQSLLRDNFPSCFTQLGHCLLVKFFLVNRVLTMIFPPSTVVTNYNISFSIAIILSSSPPLFPATFQQTNSTGRNASLDPVVPHFFTARSLHICPHVSLLHPLRGCASYAATWTARDSAFSDRFWRFFHRPTPLLVLVPNLALHFIFRSRKIKLPFKQPFFHLVRAISRFLWILVAGPSDPSSSMSIFTNYVTSPLSIKS